MKLMTMDQAFCRGFTAEEKTAGPSEKLARQLNEQLRKTLGFEILAERFNASATSSYSWNEHQSQADIMWMSCPLEPK